MSNLGGHFVDKIDGIVEFPYISKKDFWVLSLRSSLFYLMKWRNQVYRALNRHKEVQFPDEPIGGAFLFILFSLNKEYKFLLALKEYARETIGEAFKMTRFTGSE